jgi:hypothetical protein
MPAACVILSEAKDLAVIRMRSETIEMRRVAAEL